MESDWRFNVYLYGLMGQTPLLYARLAGGGPARFLLGIPTPGGRVGFTGATGFLASGELVFLADGGPFTGRFPYGIAVMPD